MVNDDDTINSVIESLYKAFEDPEFVENFNQIKIQIYFSFEVFSSKF